MQYEATIEPISSCLRVFKRGASFGADPYEFSATVVYHQDGKVAELKGVRTGGDVSFVAMRRAICTAFYIQGVDYVFWERRSKTEKKRVFMDTRTGNLKRGFNL